MKERKLPSNTGNCLLDALSRAEEIAACFVCNGPYGLSLNSQFPNGIYLNITVDPYVHFGTQIPDPQNVESFTVRFVAYTAEDDITANFLTTEDIEKLMHAESPEIREAAVVLQEFTGKQLEISKKEYEEAEGAVADRERLRLEDLCRLEEEQVQGLSGHLKM